MVRANATRRAIPKLAVVTDSTAAAAAPGDLLVAAPLAWDEATFAVPTLRGLLSTGLRIAILHPESQSAFWATLPGIHRIPYPDRAWRWAALALVLILWLLWSFDPFGRRKAAEAKAAAAEIQSAINSVSAEVNDTRAANVARATRKAEEGRRAVQKAPDLDSALAEYGDAIDRVRAEGHSPVADPHGKR